MAAPRRVRRRLTNRDDCDEVPTRIRKGDMGTLTDNFGIHADTGVQICDGFYTSTYQLAHCNVLPTSPAVEVPEFPVQRMEPCRTLGNFEVGSAYGCRRRSRSQSPSGFRLRNVSPVGSHSPRPDKDGEAFANSLRKYPTSSDRLPTAQLLQKLIKQAQDKYSAKTSQPPKMRNVSEKISPVNQGSRSSKNLQTTRSRNDSPKNEIQATKKGRSGFTSPSPQCSREIVAEGTYDYLNTDPETRGDRARGSVASALRQMFGGTRAMVAYPICPKILSRYEQHRKQHHTSDEQKPQDGQASGSKGFFPWPTCEPVDASTSCPHQRPCQPKPSICLCRELRASEDELQERLRLQEIVCAWLDNLPVSAKEKPQDKFMRDAMIRKLIDTLSGMNDEEFDAKGKEEIAKCVNEIPMWLPQQDSEKFKQELVDNLFERIKGFRRRDRFKDVIAKWLDKIEFNEDVDRDEIVSTFSSALKEIALNRPTNDGIYRDKLKTKAYELLEALPIAADTDREGLLALKAEQLADELVRLPKDQVKPDSYFEADSDEMAQLKALEAFAKGIQDREFGAIIMKALNEVDGLRELSTEIKEKEIKYLISKLPNLLTDEEEFAAKETYDQVHKFLDKIAGDNAVNLEDKIKVKFMDNLVDNLEDTFAHHLELGESISKFLVDLPKPPKPTPAQPGLASGRSDRSPQKPTDKRRDSAESYLEDEKSPTGQGLASKRGKRPQKPTGERRVSGQSDLEDESATIRKTVGGTRGRQAEKRPVSGQSYVEDDGSPTSQGLAGKRSASPRGQTEKRRLSGQSYSEDQGVSTGRKAVGGVRSPQAEKRRFSAQSYLENEGSPIGQGSPDGKISISPRGQTDRRRLSGQSYVEDDGSPTGRRAVEGTRSLQSDKRGVSSHSYLEDDGISTGQGLASDKRGFSQKPSDKRRATGQSYLEEDVSPTDRKAVASTRSRQADKRRASGQSYLEDLSRPTGQFSPGGNRSISPRGRFDKRRPSGQSFEDDDSPASQGLTSGKRSISPRGQTGKRRISGESYLEDDGSPTDQGSPVDKRSSPRGRTEKRRISGQSYLDEFGPAPQQRDDFGPFIRPRDALSPASSRRDNVTPASQSKGGTRSTSPKRQNDKRRHSGKSYLEDNFGPTSQRRDDFGHASQGRDRNTSPQRQTDRRRISGQSYVNDDFGSASQKRDDFRPASQRKDVTRSTSPHKATGKRRLSGQSYVPDDFEPASQRSDDFGHISQRKDDYSDKRRYSGQSYLDEGTPTSLHTKGSAIPQQADDKRQGKDKYGDTSGPPYGSPSPRPHGRRPSIDIIGNGSPMSYGQSIPEDKASERMPMRPTIIDIESPDEISLAKRDAIPSGQRFGPGQLRNYQVYDKTGVSNQVQLSKRDVIPTGQRLGSDQLRNNNRVYDKTDVSDQVQVSGNFDTDKKRTLAEDRSKEDKAYSKEMGHLSDKSGLSDQPTVTKNYLKERDDVSKTKDKIESQTPVGKQVQVTEPQAKSYISYSREPGKGISQVDSKEVGGQVLPQSKGLIIDDKQAKPNDIGKVAKSQQKAESKSPESGSSKVQTSREQDSKETSGDKISSAQKTVGLKPQREEKKRPSLNAESSIGLSPSQLKPHMKDEGKNTVKKMKSFLGRYRKRVGLKKSGELTEVEETPESLTRDSSSSERLDQRRVSFSSDENILGSSHKRAMKNGVHDILDLTGPNLKNKSEVELKLADLLEDLVMRGMDEDSAWEQLLSILGPDVTLEDAQDIFSKLMGTAHEISASMDPEGISRIARGRGASTPKKDKMTGGKEGQELEFDGEFDDELDDEFDDEFGGKFGDGDDEFDDEWESEFDGKTDKEREQERLRKEAEKEYNRIMFDNVKEWMGDNHILRTDAERDAVAQQLANDFVDRQKYLQLNPDAKTSPAEELEHMKYQVFKRINKLLDPEEVNAVMVKVPELMERIKNVPIPQLTKGAKGAFVASPEEFKDAITDWMKKTPLFKKQSEKQKDAMLNEMVPNIAEGLSAAVQPFLTGISNENPDKVLIEEIVKNFKKTLPPREARASLLEGMGKDLLKHLKALQLIPDNLNASVLGTSAMSGFNDVVSKWCNQLPIPNTEQGNKIKHDLANNIMAEIGELNMNPQILNDDILYDDILADFLEVQLNAVPDEIDNKEALITELLEEVKKLRQPLQHIMAGKLYNEKLRDAVDKTLPPIDKRNEAEEASFEIMKDNLADAFINLHYVGGNCALRNIFKNKINDEIDKFANEYLARHPNEPLCRTQLKKNMYSALRKVDVPGEESMKSEVERVRMKDLIDEWAKELPMKCQSPAELLHTNKVLKAMTQRILDLEKENQLNPSDDYDEKLEKEIEKFVKRLPVIERSSLKEQQNLAKMIKDTQESRTYTEGSRRSIEDLSASVCQPLQKEAKSASLSGLCQHCRSSVMQSSRSYEPSCKDAALSPPPIDCCSQTEVVHKQDRFAQCKCSKTELSRVEPCPNKSCPSKPGPSKPCPSKPCPNSNPCPSTKACPHSNLCPKSNPCPSRNPSPAKQHVSTPCNTPRPRVSTGSQAHITPYIIVDDDDTPTDQASVCLSNPCLSSMSIPKVPCGTTTLEPCYSPPCRPKATRLGSFDNNEYKSCTRRKIRNVDTQSRESCFHSPRKVWSRPQSYRDTIPCAPLNNTGCRGQMQNCRSRRCYGHDPTMACPKCCGMKCPHPAKFYFR